MITGTYQAEVTFPDWKGYVDDTLAMNSMYSFDGNYYTTSTLGFVPQILYMGTQNDPKEALNSLIKDMVNEKQN